MNLESRVSEAREGAEVDPTQPKDKGKAPEGDEP